MDFMDSSHTPSQTPEHYSGSLIGIATHQVAKGEITTHTQASISLEKGLDDYPGRKNPDTAITLLSLQSWQDACHEVGAELDWTQRRAQLLIDRIDFRDADIGRQIQIGSVIVEITRETDPCALMDKLHPGLKQALTPYWRGGARCRVIQAGNIQQGDTVHWVG